MSTRASSATAILGLLVLATVFAAPSQAQVRTTTIVLDVSSRCAQCNGQDHCCPDSSEPMCIRSGGRCSCSCYKAASSKDLVKVFGSLVGGAGLPDVSTQEQNEVMLKGVYFSLKGKAVELELGGQTVQMGVSVPDSTRDSINQFAIDGLKTAGIDPADLDKRIAYIDR